MKVSSFGRLLAGFLVGERFFEQFELTLHHLQVVYFGDGLPFIFYGVLVIAGGVVTAAQSVQEAGLARFAAFVQLKRTMRVANRFLKVTLGVRNQPCPLVKGRRIV